VATWCARWNTELRILLVEDDRKAARLVRKRLHETGFVVDVAHSAEDADEMTATVDYAAIVLDWLLPGKDGIAFCRELRARGVPTPILMLTARRGSHDCVTGLNAGADGCLAKPFALAELIARLHALLRRSTLTRSVVLTIGDLSLDPARRTVINLGSSLGGHPCVGRRDGLGGRKRGEESHLRAWRGSMFQHRLSRYPTSRVPASAGSMF
jgi:DNA-binding response OmpR family regulator